MDSITSQNRLDHTNSTLFKLLIFLFAIILGACSSGGNDDGGGVTSTIPMDQVQADIPPEGGEITSLDGAVTLVFPEGALDESTLITITPIAVDDLPSEFDEENIEFAYELGPSGLQFNEPIEVKFSYPSDNIDEEGFEAPIGLTLVTSSNNELEYLDQVALIISNEFLSGNQEDSNSLDDLPPPILTGQLNHFSPVALKVAQLNEDGLPELTNDKVKLGGVPPWAYLNQPFEVEARLTHLDLSKISADRVLLIEDISDVSRVQLTLESRNMFSEADSSTVDEFINFGAVAEGVANNQQRQLNYICIEPGIGIIDLKFEYQDYDNEFNFYRQNRNLNQLRLKAYVVCIDPNTTPGTTTAEDIVKVENDHNVYYWNFSSDRAQITEEVGNDFTLTVNFEPPAERQYTIRAYIVWLLDPNHGVISFPQLGNSSGINAVWFEDDRPPEIKNFMLSSSGDQEVDSQTIQYSCLKTGSTLLALQFRTNAGSANIGIKDHASEDGAHFLVEVNCVAPEPEPDTDNDGTPDSEDDCPTHPDEDCAQEQETDDGKVSFGCRNDQNCSITESNGNCADCVIRLNELATQTIAYQMDCNINANCSTFIEGDDLISTLQCTSGDSSGSCSVETPVLSATCDNGADCTLQTHFSCSSNDAGEGCSGTLVDDSELACPTEGKRCDIFVAPTFSSDPEIDLDLSTLDILKNANGGDGEFVFTVDIDNLGETISESFEITTLNGVGISEARLYGGWALDYGYLQLTEVTNNQFELQPAACAPSENVNLTTNFNITQVSGFASCESTSQFIVQNNTVIITLPDNATGPGEVKLLPPGIFGLPTNKNFVSIGVDTGSLIMDVDTGEVPTVGSSRLSYVDDNSLSYGVTANYNDFINNGDILESYGPNTLLRQYDPNLEQMSTPQIGFENFTQITNLQGDINNSSVLRVNNFRNQIEARIPSAMEFGGWRNQVIIRPENLQDLNGNVVSTFAWELGELICYNPCSGNGEPMPAVCGEIVPAIAQVTTNLPSCSSFWSPNSCRNEYNDLTGGQCDLFDLGNPAGQVNFGGMVIGVTDASPSELFLADPAFTFTGRANVIGPTGNGAQRIECVPDWCAVTNFESDTLTIIQWDGLFNASIFTTLSVGDGPIGLEMFVEDNEVFIYSTGSNDNTLFLTTFLASDGSNLVNSTISIDEECEGPVDVEKVNVSSYLISCSLSDNILKYQP